MYCALYTACMHTHCLRCFPPPPALAPYRSVAEAVQLGTCDAPGCTAEEGVSGAFAFGLAVGAAPVTATDVTATDATATAAAGAAAGSSSEVLSPHPHQALAVPLQSTQAQQQQLRQQQEQQESSVYSHDSSEEADMLAQQQQQHDEEQQQQQQQQQRLFVRAASQGGSRQELMEQLARAASEQGVSESDAIAWIIERMEAENQVISMSLYCITI
jgi:hypothetical protein